MSFEPSREQAMVVPWVQDKWNIQVSAVPGAGKSQSVFYVASQCPHIKFILITYSRSLSDKSRKQIKDLKLENIQAYTYHSLISKITQQPVFDDESMLNITSTSSNETCCLKDLILDGQSEWLPDYFVLDEVQDMNYVYYESLLYVMKLMNWKGSMWVLGDERQTICQYNDAQSHFLNMAHQIWNHVLLYPSKWKIHQFTVTYRLPNPVASLINQCINDEKKGDLVLHTPPSSLFSSPSYSSSPSTKQQQMHLPCLYEIHETCISQVIIKIICGWVLSKKKIKPHDIAIICPSVKPGNKFHSVIKEIENTLVCQYHIPCYVSCQEQPPNYCNNSTIEEELEQDKEQKKNKGVMVGYHNKLVISTSHFFKGCERKCIIVMGVDGSYHDIYSRFTKHEELPNPLYVALTRCTEQLVMIQQGPELLKCWKQTDLLLNKYTSYNVISDPFTSSPMQIKKRSRSQQQQQQQQQQQSLSSLHHRHIITVTDVLKYIPASLIVQGSKCIDYTIEQMEPIIHPPMYHPDTGEYIGDINGLAIQSYIQYIHQPNNIILFTFVKQHYTWWYKKLPLYYQQGLNYLITSTPSSWKPQHWLLLCLLYSCFTQGYISRCYQITHTDWVPEPIWKQIIDSCYCHLNKYLLKAYSTQQVIRFEYPFCYSNILYPGCSSQLPITYDLKGNVDMVTLNCSSEHDPQLLVEIKCVEKIETIHLLQLALYYWLTKHTMNTGTCMGLGTGSDVTACLYSVYTSSWYKLNINMEKINQWVHDLLLFKFSEGKPDSIQDFLLKCKIKQQNHYN